MFVVIAYDIPDNKRRTKVMKLLEGYGAHVQESVFECDLRPRIYRQMRQRLHKMLELTADNVCVYHLCQTDIDRIEHLGIGREVQLIENFKIV